MSNQRMLISLFLLFIGILLATDIPSCNSPELLSKEDDDSLFISPLSMSNPPVVTVTTKCKHQSHGMPIPKSQVIKYDPSLDESNETKTHTCLSSNINYEDAQIIHSAITSAQRLITSSSTITTATVTITSSQMSTITITSSLEVTTTLSSSPQESLSAQTVTITESKAPVSEEMACTKAPEVTTSTTTLISTEFITITASSSSSSESSSIPSSSSTSVGLSDSLSSPGLETATTNTLSSSSLSSSSSSFSSESNYKFPYSTSFEPTISTSHFSTESAIQSQMGAEKFPFSTTLSSSSLSSLQSTLSTTSLSESRACNCTSNTNITSYSSSTEITSNFMLNIFSFSNITIPVHFSYPFSYFFSYQLRMLQTNVTTINQMAIYLQTTNILSAMWSESIQTQKLITKILEHGEGKFIFDIATITKLLLQFTTTTITNILQKLRIINMVEEHKLTIDCFTAMMSVIASGTAIDTCHKNVWYDQIINRHQYPIISVISSMLNGNRNRNNNTNSNSNNRENENGDSNNWNDIQMRLAVRNYFESIYQNRYYQKYYGQYRERLLHWYENNFLNSNSGGVNYAKGGIIISAPILPAPGRLCPKTWGLTRQTDPWIEHLPAYIRMAYYTDQSDKPMVYFREETCALCKMKRMGLLAKGEYCYLCKVERVKQRLLEMPGGVLQAVFQTLLMMNSPSDPSPHESIPAPVGVSVVVPAPPATIFPLLYPAPSTG